MHQMMQASQEMGDAGPQGAGSGAGAFSAEALDPNQNTISNEGADPSGDTSAAPEGGTP